MRNLEDYIRELSPKEKDQAILIYGGQYHIWLEGNYLGIAMWTEDEYLGDSFQNQFSLNGELYRLVYVADAWELVISRRKQRPTN